MLLWDLAVPGDRKKIVYMLRMGGVRNETQQDLNKMIDFVNFGGQKFRPDAVFPLHRLQAGYWVRVDYYIMVNRIHVPVIVQCQIDGCSINSKDGAVVWQSFRAMAVGCLTILEMEVDDCSWPPLSFIFEPSV